MNERLTSFDLNTYFENSKTYFISGFSDGNVYLSTLNEEEISEQLDSEFFTENINADGKNKIFEDVFNYKNHKSEITALEFYPSETSFGFVVCSKEKYATFLTGKMDEELPKFSERYKITSHMNTITSCSFHPLKEYAIFSSSDNYWSFHNLLKVIIKKA